MPGAEQTLRSRAQRELREAMRGRDRARIAALRTLIAALDNATAVPVQERADSMAAASAEVPRKVLTDEDVRAVLMSEIAERHNAAFAFEMHGGFEEASALRAEIELIERYVKDIESMEGTSPQG